MYKFFEVSKVNNSKVIEQYLKTFITLTMTMTKTTKTTAKCNCSSSAELKIITKLNLQLWLLKQVESYYVLEE